MNYKERKKRVLEHYSRHGDGKCAECGKDDMQPMYIVFLDGTGAEFKKLKGLTSAYTFYSWLIDQNFPDLPLRILCKKHFHEFCSKIRSGVKRTPEQRARMLQAQKLSGIKTRKDWFDEIDREAEKNKNNE